MISMLCLRFIYRFLLRKKKVPVVKEHISNPMLPTIRHGWTGTPLDQDGLFINQEFPTVLSFQGILKFMTQSNPQRTMKKQDSWRIEVKKDDSWLDDKQDKIVWIGHASFFIQLSGVRILIDPMFGNLPVAKRFSDMPVDPHKITGVDFILVSHAHYDHCDKKSLTLLTTINPQAQVLCGLRLNHLLEKWMDNTVQAAGWYQQYKTGDNTYITFLPSRHWANRGVFDVNNTLWGGFMIQKAGKCIYYSGDSGYGTHFSDIGKQFPDINIALIGAGAYAPTWFMGQHHQNPYEAVDAFHATGASILVPFHYGTFDSADEPMGEPEQILNKLDAANKINGKLKVMKLGEPLQLN